MRRLFILMIGLNFLVSCSKKEITQNPPMEIPDDINGVVTELTVTPADIATPDKGSFLMFANSTVYKVDFNAVPQAQANAQLIFETDTLLIDGSREFTNLGKDAIAYYPLRANLITIFFNNGKKITAQFDQNTSFGGAFGESLIAQWRDPADPAKPTQKAKNDITGFIERYSDKDGPGPGFDPIYLFIEVTKH